MSDILLLDNFDSFTYNLVDQCRNLGRKVVIYRNDIETDLLLDELAQLNKPTIILSPGPGAPSDAGCMIDLIKAVRGKIPMIGICLGHQALIEAYGGIVDKSSEIIHGKSSQLIFEQHPIFNDIPQGFQVARYHSLVGVKMPEQLRIIGKTENDLVMALVNEADRVCGFQFHPESILTTYGEQLLINTLKWAKG